MAIFLRDCSGTQTDETVHVKESAGKALRAISGHLGSRPDGLTAGKKTPQQEDQPPE